jgi:hypothetical protein
VTQSTTTPNCATPGTPSRQEPPKWLTALIGTGMVALVLWSIGSCAAHAVSVDPPASSGLSQQAVAAPPPAPLPDPSQFDIKVKVLKKQCFGSAGCNVVYQIDPTYTGTTPLPQQTMTVVYEVSGDESGPSTNNFTIQRDGKASYPSQETASTPSSRVTLTAKAVSVSGS